MFKVGSFGKRLIFTVVGYREEESGILFGPCPIVQSTSLSHARQACVAALWVDADKWCCVAIEGKDGFELVRFRRFPPDRQLEFFDNIDNSMFRSTGPRLSVSASGTMKRKKVGV